MHLGTQLRPRSDDDYKVFAQLGVEHICGWPPEPGSNWTVDYLARYKEHVESFGINLDILPLPLTSLEKPNPENPNILLGKSPERDREIEHICDIIRMVAAIGVPTVKYALSIVDVVSTEPAAGRGGSVAREFVYEKARRSSERTIAGEVDADAMWERITHFIDRVVPVAEEYKVRLACHPPDPGVPSPEGIKGVDQVMGSVDGLKRFIDLSPSPYHGLNFCQGSVSEMLEKPGEEIYDVIRYFGKRNRIFNMHFRNIRGGFLNFVETFPDEGDVDMHRAMETYKEVGYKYMIMPDHTPTISGDNAQMVSFAYCYGYINAMIQAVSAEL